MVHEVVGEDAREIDDELHEQIADDQESEKVLADSDPL
jgi:hypothetical protein